MPTENIYIIDDDIYIRDALNLYLSQQGYSVYTFKSAEDFLSVADQDLTGCVIIDLNLEGINALQALDIFHERHLNLATIVITAHGDVKSARQAFLSHALDFIEKPYDPEELIAAIKNALRLVNERRLTSKASDGTELTPREIEVKDLLLAGKNNKEIADNLGISVRTVEAHRSRILEKLGYRSVVDLIRLSPRS